MQALTLVNEELAFLCINNNRDDAWLQPGTAKRSGMEQGEKMKDRR
jgi:hypothetical protein